MVVPDLIVGDQVACQPVRGYSTGRHDNGGQSAHYGRLRHRSVTSGSPQPTSALAADRTALAVTVHPFASPHFTDARRPWDQSNCAKTLAALLADADLSWATPHTFRRTVATRLHARGIPLVQIADQLGHSDPSMTARVYLGRDLMGDRLSVAEALER